MASMNIAPCGGRAARVHQGRWGAHDLTACTHGMNVRPPARPADGFKSSPSPDDHAPTNPLEATPVGRTPPMPMPGQPVSATLEEAEAQLSRLPAPPRVFMWTEMEQRCPDGWGHLPSVRPRAARIHRGGTWRVDASSSRRGWRSICAWARWLRPRVRR